MDGQDFADVEEYGLKQWLGELALALKRRLIVRLLSDAFTSPRPTANFARLASQPCAIGS